MKLHFDQNEKEKTPSMWLNIKHLPKLMQKKLHFTTFMRISWPHLLALFILVEYVPQEYRDKWANFVTGSLATMNKRNIVDMVCIHNCIFPLFYIKMIYIKMIGIVAVTWALISKAHPPRESLTSVNIRYFNLQGVFCWQES